MQNNTDTPLYFSVIIPVYNRPNEVDELLTSLRAQTYSHFEIVIVEDGSTLDAKEVIANYEGDLTIRYFFKDNSGPGDSRNFGMDKALGDYLVFFDSDCIIPPQYFETAASAIHKHNIDAYGGPDAAHESFSIVQKAINYAMTSVITTGGVRGKENKLDNYQPRTFNMGMRKSVYNDVGHFSDIHPGEDPDLSYRIMNAGYKIALIQDAYVYHKRRIDFKKFATQVYKFGMVRNVLMRWYPDKFKFVYTFPSIFLLGSIFLLILSLALQAIWPLAPLIFLVVLLFLDSLVKTKHLVISILAVPASFIQLYAYGFGFLKGYFYLHILKLNERKALKSFFFKEK